MPSLTVFLRLQARSYLGTPRVFSLSGALHRRFHIGRLSGKVDRQVLALGQAGMMPPPTAS
jgi:hypothetical protein